MSENILPYQSEASESAPAKASESVSAEAPKSIPSTFSIKDSPSKELIAELALLRTGYERGEFRGEVRCYHVPGFIVQQEYELLSYYREGSFFDLANIVRDDLCGILFLMKELNVDVDVSSDTMHLIAGNISRSVELLRCICSHQADFTLLHVSTSD